MGDAHRARRSLSLLRLRPLTACAIGVPTDVANEVLVPIRDVPAQPHHLLREPLGAGHHLNSAARDAPDNVRSLVADKTTGMALVNAVLAALFHRERTGQGQYVEVPMFETMVAFILAEHLGGLTFDPAPVGAGYARLLDGGRKPAPTLDGYIAMLPYTGEHWRDFFAAGGRPDLAEKYGIADREARGCPHRCLASTPRKSCWKRATGKPRRLRWRAENGRIPEHSFS